MWFKSTALFLQFENVFPDFKTVICSSCGIQLSRAQFTGSISEFELFGNVVSF